MPKCILCDASAVTSRQDNASRTIYNCTYCGVYVISDPVESEVKSNKWKIAAFLVNRHLHGRNDIVLISIESIARDKGYVHMSVDQILKTFPTSMTDRTDMALQNLVNKSEYPGAEVRIESISQGPILCLEYVNFESMSFIISSLEKSGYVSVNYYGSAFFPCNLTVTVEGWDRVASLEKDQESMGSAMIAISGAHDYSEDYVRVATRACISNGHPIAEYPCYDSDHKIGHQLIAAVRESSFIVCDLSTPDTSAYYVAGMARALNKTIILTCKYGSHKKPGMELEQLSVLFWKNEEELFACITNAIRALIH